MGLKAKNYTKLWSKPMETSHIKVSSGNYESYCKKLIDNLCLEADLAEDLNEYVNVFAKGMINIIQMGIPKSLIGKHNIAITKILRLGEDIVENTEEMSDFFYLGLFIDQKVHGSWYDIGFYQVILKMIKLIHEKLGEIPQLFKLKIEELLKQNNYPLYALYFLKNRNSKFLSSA